MTTMQTSVEARVPFLDHNLIEFSYRNIPYNLKLRWVNEEAKNKANIIIDKHYAELYEKYQIALKDNNAVDFDDLLLLPLQIFEKFPKVLASYQEKWKYILVDEYQDTNKPQFMLSLIHI